MTCTLVNGCFVLAMLGILPGVILGFVAQQHRTPEASPFRYWKGGWDLFRPSLFTKHGNRIRRLSLAFSLTGAAFLVLCLALVFGLRDGQLGMCWFQS